MLCLIVKIFATLYDDKASLNSYFEFLQKCCTSNKKCRKCRNNYL